MSDVTYRIKIIWVPLCKKNNTCRCTSEQKKKWKITRDFCSDCK